MLVKLDIRKAYDHVNKSFLLKIMWKSGFQTNLLEWIKSCISTPRMFVLVNGSPQGFSSTTSGIRQSDPLSPFLFVVMAEALGQLINRCKEDGRWKGIKVAHGVEAVTHTQFANDTLLMGEASVREARTICNTLDKYCTVSSQAVNWHKSEFYCFNTHGDIQREISRVLGIKMGRLPGKFLGIPLFEGACRLSLWNKLVENCISKMEG